MEEGVRHYKEEAKHNKLIPNQMEDRTGLEITDARVKYFFKRKAWAPRIIE